MVRTTDCTRLVRVASAAPMPRLHTESIGQPMLMSTKSTLACSSSSCATRPIALGWLPAICTPKTSSHGWRLSSAHSELEPWRSEVASAISPHVTSTPSPLHTRRKGRLPTVVSGARYVFPRKSTSLRSCSATVSHAAARS